MRTVINLNHMWAFTKQATQIPTEMPQLWDFVNLPHTWNNLDGQDGGNDYYRGTCYYAKTLHTTEFPKSQRYYLEFRGANSSADVYMNGKHLAHHDGGYSTFRVDVTDALENETLLVVAVDNAPNDTVYPQMADFTFYGGLYRDVNLICVPDSHFDLDYFGGIGLQVTPVVEQDHAEIAMQVHLTNAQPGQILRYTISDQEGNVAASVQSKDTCTAITLPHVHLWNGRKDPYLYTCRAELLSGEEILDAVSTPFGCRSFHIDPERGFLLNGEEYPLRGVSRHQDRRDIGNALLPEHHKEDMDLICEMGANTIRLAHYQHDQYFYDLCDQRGMVVWAEIPYISAHMPGGRENTISQMKELVTQNYHHPSIVVWGLSNEITMQSADQPDLLENHQILNELVHKMDPNRLTAVAAISSCSMDAPYLKLPDVVSYNHYFGWYGGDTSMNGPWFDQFHKTHPNTPIGCSEYGCEALDWHSSDPRQGDYTEEYQAHYHEELIRQLFPRKYIWATHVWNMFDFAADARCEGGENGMNHKGLVTFDRKYKKDAFYAYKAWLSPEPFVHLCGKRYVDRVEPVTKVTVYSNLPKVELFANGISLGIKEAPDHFFYFDVPNCGETVLTAVADGCMDESHIRKVEVFNETYRLREKNAVLNWYDITEKEGYFSLNDTLGDILSTPQGKTLFVSLAAQKLPKIKNTPVINDDVMQTISGFTVIRLASMMSVMNVCLPLEDLLALNKELNQIPKP